MICIQIFHGSGIWYLWIEFKVKSFPYCCHSLIQITFIWVAFISVKQFQSCLSLNKNYTFEIISEFLKWIFLISIENTHNLFGRFHTSFVFDSIKPRTFIDILLTYDRLFLTFPLSPPISASGSGRKLKNIVSDIDYPNK